MSPGDDLSKNYKVTIEDISPPNPSDSSGDPYGTFTVVIKGVADRAKKAEQIVEVFSNCNLNPNSANYVARRIGDVFYTWDESEERYKYYGNYKNNSDLVRVEMNEDVDNGSISPDLVPWGYFGPIAPVTIAATDSTAAAHDDATKSKWLLPWTVALKNDGNAITGTGIGTFEYEFPKARLLSSHPGDDLSNSYFGFSTITLDTSGKLSASRTYNSAHADHIAIRSKAITSESGTPGDSTKNNYSWYFSLDDIKLSGSAGADLSFGEDNPVSVHHINASRALETAAADVSYTAKSGSFALTQMGVDQFVAPFYGGHDGVDITEADPFRNKLLVAATDAQSSYEYATLERAILSAKDPEVVECNVLCAPGLTEPRLTAKLVSTAETRADALAIIDLPNVYIPPHEEKQIGGMAARLGTTAKQSARTFKDRGLTSSYGCTYYPWVKVADTINDAQLWVPPSVVALGVFGFTEERNEIWFAPAGFNRGGLDRGNAGLKVLNTTEHLSSKERDTLYEANINPIAKFPSEGIVVFGQKTMQVTQSALDRINVRRLLIFLKKEISRIASSLLFDQNVPATWNRFLGKTLPFLDSVKSRLGLSDYRVILDETTTTPDLIDRNIMYAKIFLKPARAIEFIAIDFIITNTGASFED